LKERFHDAIAAVDPSIRRRGDRRWEAAFFVARATGAIAT
jgi:hypothetical protein